MTLADDHGTDIEAFRTFRNPNSIHVEVRSDASEDLLAYLDTAGLDRRQVVTDGSTYVWHETPAGLSQRAQKQLVSRALAHLSVVGYEVNIDPAEFDVTAWAQAMKVHHQTRNAALPTSPPPTPPAPPRPGR